MKTISLSTAILAFASLAGAASAQDIITTTSDTYWRGFYAGGNLGGAWNSTCNSWTPANGISNPTIATAFYNRNCPNNSTFIGGVQIGYNFQKNQPFNSDSRVRLARGRSIRTRRNHHVGYKLARLLRRR